MPQVEGPMMKRVIAGELQPCAAIEWYPELDHFMANKRY